MRTISNCIIYFIAGLITSTLVTLDQIPKEDQQEYIDDFFKEAKHCEMFTRTDKGELQMNLNIVVIYAEKPTAS